MRRSHVNRQTECFPYTCTLHLNTFEMLFNAYLRWIDCGLIFRERVSETLLNVNHEHKEKIDPI